MSDASDLGVFVGLRIGDGGASARVTLRNESANLAVDLNAWAARAVAQSLLNAADQIDAYAAATRPTAPDDGDARPAPPAEGAP